MRALTSYELDFVSGGSITGPEVDRRGYRILTGQIGGSSETFTDQDRTLPTVYVYADRQSHGLFSDGSEAERGCRTLASGAGAFAGDLAGEVLSAALTDVELALAVLAAPETGGSSVVGAVMIAGVQRNYLRIGGGVLGGSVGFAVGSMIC